MEPERRGGAEKVEKLGFRAAMHIDGSDAVGKLAFNGGMHVVKTETKQENGFKYVCGERRIIGGKRV